MKRISNLAWELHDALPPQVTLRGPQAFRLLRSLVHPVTVTVLRGSARQSERPGTVVTAGAEPWAEYLAESFLEGRVQRELVGRVPLWTLPSILRSLWPSVDLVTARVDRLSARLLFRVGYLLVPEWVDLRLGVPEDVGALTRGNSSLKSDLRKIRRNGLSFEVSPAGADLETFYGRYYLPYARKHYGKYAYIRRLDALRRYYHHGALLWVLHRGERVAGCLVSPRDKMLRAVALGTLRGDQQHVEMGAISAIYYYVLEYARTLGCEEINYGGTRPILTDGALRFKRKWRMRMVEQPNCGYEFLIHWRRIGEDVLDLLSHTPLVFRDDDGLSAVAAIAAQGPVTQRQAQRAYRFLRISGLQTLYLLSATGWEAACEAPPHTCLIDLRAGGSDQLPMSLDLDVALHSSA